MMGAKGAIHDGSVAELANPQAGAIAIAPGGLSDADAGTLGGGRHYGHERGRRRGSR